MAWPLRTWAATQTLGVYYTLDSLDPAAAQPAWTALNTGLSNTDVLSFCLDRSEDPADGRMFCIDNTTRTLWRRVIGDWSAVLTSAAARTLAGFVASEVLWSVTVDDITGYVYANLAELAASSKVAVLRSIDHGNTWTAVVAISAAAFIYTISNIDAYNGLVVFMRMRLIPGTVGHWYSVDHGATWSALGTAGLPAPLCARINRAAGNYWYGNFGIAGVQYGLTRGNTAGAGANLWEVEQYGPQATAGGIWCDPLDANRSVSAAWAVNSIFVVTTDAFATIDSNNAISITYMHEIADCCEYGYWVQGCSLPVTPGRAPVYVSTDGVTLGQKSGTNWETPPYTNAIPVTCGGIAGRGLWLVPGAPPVPPAPILPPVPPFRPHAGQHGISMSVFKPRITLAP